MIKIWFLTRGEGGLSRFLILLCLKDRGYCNMCCKVLSSLYMSPSNSWVKGVCPAAWGRPLWRRQPFATHVAIPPFCDMDSIHRLGDSNLQPDCQRLEFHTHTDFFWQRADGGRLISDFGWQGGAGGSSWRQMLTAPWTQFWRVLIGGFSEMQICAEKRPWPPHSFRKKSWGDWIIGGDSRSLGEQTRKGCTDSTLEWTGNRVSFLFCLPQSVMGNQGIQYKTWFFFYVKVSC